MRGLQRAESQRARWPEIGWSLTLLLLLPPISAYAEPRGGECVAWPGEMDPLPTTSDADPFAARWARMRAAELSRLAAGIESDDPSEAYRIWVHAQCLDPGSVAAVRVRALTPAFATAIRPAPRYVPPPPRPPARKAVQARPRPQDDPDAESRARELSALDAQVTAAAEALARARFSEALDTAKQLRTRLDGLPAKADVDVRRLRVRTEVLCATAEVALGLSDAAVASFTRALAADPELALDSATTSPKILRVLEEARQSQERSTP